MLGEPRYVELEYGRTDRSEHGLSLIAILVVGSLTIAAALAVSYGLALEDQRWVVGGAAIFAPLLVLSAHAAWRFEPAPWSAALVATAVLLFSFMMLIVVSSTWWDRSATSVVSFTLASTDPSAHVYLRAKPEGAELVAGRRAPAPLGAGKRYDFACEVTLGDGTRWLRLDGTRYWVPGTVLLPAAQGAAKRVARC